MFWVSKLPCCQGLVACPARPWACLPASSSAAGLLPIVPRLSCVWSCKRPDYFLCLFSAQKVLPILHEHNLLLVILNWLEGAWSSVVLLAVPLTICVSGCPMEGGLKLPKGGGATLTAGGMWRGTHRHTRLSPGAHAQELMFCPVQVVL